MARFVWSKQITLLPKNGSDHAVWKYVTISLYTLNVINTS